MKFAAIAVLCLVTTLPAQAGDAAFGTPGTYDFEGPGFAYVTVAGVVGVVVLGAVIISQIDRANSRYHFKPGLNVRCPEKLDRGRLIEVKVAVADGRAKQQKNWWSDGRVPQVSLRRPDGTLDTTPSGTSVKKEWFTATFVTSESGAYRLTVTSEVPSGQNPTTTAPVETVREIRVK